MPTPNPFLLHLFAALAERERRIIGERTRLALAAAKARGVKLGGTDEQSIKNREAALARAEELRAVLSELCRPRNRGRIEQAPCRDANRPTLASADGQPGTGAPRPA